MVQISINKETQEVVIKIKIWALYQVMDNRSWLKAIHEKAMELVIKEIMEQGSTQADG